jgi:23S rRNA (cytidine1920-2'-O)/16S rRNA (cytidine1409-2'-O)-methyltransferase
VRRRLDTELVRRGLAASRTEAQAAVDAGLVTVGGRPAGKSSTMVADSEPVALAAPPRRFVSRGGDKLDAALDRFGVDPRAVDALDAGASTGGFTDVLLRRGAARVAAVDVGYGQLAWSLRQDPRVIILERTNVRDLTADDLPFVPGLVVADLSFISLRVVLPALAAVAGPEAAFVLLVKPQFEVGPARVGSGGVVRDPEAWRSALDGVAATLAELGRPVRGAMASPVLGPAGNVEFLVFARSGGGDAAELGAAVAEGIALRGAATGERSEP